MSDNAKKRPWWIRIAILAVFATAAYFAHIEIQSYLGSKARAATGLEMRTIEEAKALALAQSKPVLVELSAVWCAACRQFDKAVLSDPEVQEAINGGYVFAHLEYESEAGKAFMEQYEVGGFPTTYILTADGTFVRQLKTTLNPVEFAKQLTL